MLVHEQFDGRRWRHRVLLVPGGRVFQRLGREPAGGGWWNLQSARAVPWDGSALPTSPDQWITPEGELLVGAASHQPGPFACTLPTRWRPGSSDPLPSERHSPPDSLPRLKTLARQFRELPTGRERLEAVEDGFGVSPSATAFSPARLLIWMLLFDQQVGFCGHYASSLAALMQLPVCQPA